jgi:chromosome segregation ATPase
MTADSDWDALRARLEQTQEAVAAEIHAYPPPIPACDAQFDHLLERREALSEALARLDAARKNGSSTLESFLAELPDLDEGGRLGD